MTPIIAQPLTAESFSPFGDVLDCSGDPDKLINQGLCGRYNDRATLDFDDGRAGLSLFKADLRSVPYKLEMVERHPNGSQAFVPMGMVSFLVTVAADAGGEPSVPQAFVTKPGQAINLFKNIWHGVLTPLEGSGIFAVLDRIGPGTNLEEHWFDTPYSITLADQP